MPTKNIRTAFIMLFILTSCSIEFTGLRTKFLSDFKCIKREKEWNSIIYTYVRGSDIIKIEKFSNIDASLGEALTNSDITNIKIIYSPALSAYPEQLSYLIAASEEVKPRFFEKKDGALSYKYALLYSNDRFALGVPSLNFAKYKYLIGWLYCEKTSVLYKIKMFFKIDSDFKDMEKIFLSMKCGD